MGRISFENVIPNVAVIACLKDDPAILTCLEFFLAKVSLEVGANLEDVWSIFNISEWGI